MSEGTAAVEDVEALRVPLTGYCYRLLGSAADADDAVQESLVRASMKLDRFDPTRARLTTWVHRIATNVCLDMLRGASRRAFTLDVESLEQAGELGAPEPRRWVEPMPDARLLPTDPAEQVEASASVRLAFIGALQRLAPRQRATLVLRDVLSFSARETAEILEMSEAAVNSALQRARARMAADPPDPWQLTDPEDSEQRLLLERYVAAFEAHDVAGLIELLAEDAVTTMPPFAWGLRGGARIAELMGSSDSCAGARLVPCRINGGAGFGQYRPAEDGRLRPFALVAVDVHAGRIVRIVTFLGTEGRFAEFGLPAELSPVDR